MTGALSSADVIRASNSDGIEAGRASGPEARSHSFCSRTWHERDRREWHRPAAAPALPLTASIRKLIRALPPPAGGVLRLGSDAGTIPLPYRPEQDADLVGLPTRHGSWPDRPRAWRPASGQCARDRRGVTETGPIRSGSGMKPRTWRFRPLAEPDSCAISARVPRPFYAIRLTRCDRRNGRVQQPVPCVETKDKERSPRLRGMRSGSPRAAQRRTGRRFRDRRSATGSAAGGVWFEIAETAIFRRE